MKLAKKLAQGKKVAEKLHENPESFAGAWNFGPHDIDAKPVRSVVDRLAFHWGGAANWEVDTHPQPHEAHYLKLDISKACSRLG